jgi:hypothetical protein
MMMMAHEADVMELWSVAAARPKRLQRRRRCGYVPPAAQARVLQWRAAC